MSAVSLPAARSGLAAVVLAVLLPLLPGPAVPASTLRPVAPSDCPPAAADHTFLWWANGWLDGAPREPALLCLQAGHLAAVFDPARASIVRLGEVRRPPTYEASAAAAPADADRVLQLPEARLALSVQVGTHVYTCTRAATNRKDWMNFPVRIIESGRFVQHFDILQLGFADEAGRALEAEGRLDVVAWPDRIQLRLELTLPDGSAGPELEPHLALDPAPARGLVCQPAPIPGSPAPSSRIRTAGLTILSTRDESAALIPHPDPGLGAVDRRTGEPVETGVDVPLGCLRVGLPSRRWSVAGEPDRLERIQVALTNDTPRERIVRLLFDDPTGTPGITGLTPMLRDAEGFPTGIPVQTSKNWHRQPERRMLHEGPWLHAFTLLRLPPHCRLDAEFALTWARWGGVPAASHAQLCLVGWGWNQLWDQAAIGSWGESICYEPDAVQMRCRIDDVRPLMVWGMGEGRQQWTWTHNVGGGDFLVYLDAEGRYQPWRAVRTAYLSQGPNLTDVRYSGLTADGHIACRIAVASPRTDDLNRSYHRVRYDVLQPTPFRRLAFYQVGSDRYHWHQYGRIARGNTGGLVEEWEPGRGGRKYLRTGIPCPGDAPWFSLHDAVPADGGKPVAGAWATRGLILRSWKARLGGRPAPPFASVFGTEAGQVPSANLELSPPPELTTLQPGDFVEADLELVILPMSADEYYGPNETLRTGLRGGANTWRSVHQQALGNHLHLEARCGRLVATYPPVLAVDRRGAAELEILGGTGYLPVTFTGLRSPRGWTLQSIDAQGLVRTVDQSVHSRDFWQAAHDPASGTWRLTFNLPMDSPAGTNTPRRLVLSP